MNALWDAPAYDANSQLQQSIARNFLDQEIKKKFSLSKGNTLLDIGCGPGRITEQLLADFPGIHVAGIDTCKAMIDFASINARHSNLTFKVDCAEQLSTVGDASIDAITSFSCLHWVPDLPRAFQSMNRVLKPGGWLGLIFAAETGFDDPIDHAYAKAIQEDPWQDYFKDKASLVDWNIEKPEWIKAQLTELGFQVNLAKNDHFNYSFSDKNAFIDWVLGTFQQLKLLPEEMRFGCANRIVELYLDATGSMQPADGQCIYEVDVFMILAKKPALL